jgi:hypothetical protein
MQAIGLTGKFAGICAAALLIAIAGPFALERLMLIPAGWLRLEPALIMLVVAAVLIASLLRVRAARRSGPSHK